MKLNIALLPNQLQKGVTELQKELGITVDNRGIDIIYNKENELVVDYTSNNNLSISSYNLNQFYRGLRLFKQNYNGLSIKIKEKCNFDNLGIMIDNSRNAVMKVDTVKRMIRLLAIMGYNELQLYTEDTYEVNNEPYFGYMRGRYTKAELKEIDLYAQIFGIEVIPCIQTLAHLNSIKRWKPYENIFDCNDILFVGEERTYQLIENMFNTVSECFYSRKINIGMDEALMLGRGKYLDKNGYEKRYDIMINHLKLVNDVAKKYGYKPMMWSDMFFRIAAPDGLDYYAETEIPQNIIEQVNENIDLIYWDYYHTDEKIYDRMIKSHLKFPNKIVFAGGAWKWRGFAPQNLYSIKATESALNSCIKNNIKDVLITLWGDNGGECSNFGVLPTLVFAAEKAYGSNEKDFSKHFKGVTNCELNTFMMLDLPNIIDYEAKENTYNPSKYILYNDYFTGIYDSLYEEKQKQIYKENIINFKNAIKESAEWEYLFDTLQLLCEVLYIKCDLGVETRLAYLQKDINQLEKLVENEYKPLLKKLDSFLNALHHQWMKENKPHGFQIQEIRIGGLIQRTKSCINRLKLFIDGKITSIPELEEELLDVKGNGNNFNKTPITTYGHLETASVQVY